MRERARRAYSIAHTRTNPLIHSLMHSLIYSASQPASQPVNQSSTHPLPYTHSRPHLSWCAKSDLWQSPKSRPQSLSVLSAEPEARSVESEDMSRQRAGSLWPYREREKRRVSTKNT